ncbi:unnamed protein product [Sphagnum balticum]
MALRSLAGRVAVVFRLRCATPSLAFSSHSPFSTAVVLDDLKYAKTHEWEELGVVVFVDLPEVGRQVAKGESFGVWRVSKLRVISILQYPGRLWLSTVNWLIPQHWAFLRTLFHDVNKGPFDEGWIMKVKLKDHEEVCSLLGAEKYRQLLEVSTH